MDKTPPPAASPYRVGNWTITQLKEELKQRNLSPAGRKQELIDRLERYELDNELATPRHARRNRSPSRGRGVSVKKSLLIAEDDGVIVATATPRRGRPPKKPAVAEEWASTPLRVAAARTPPSARRSTPTRTGSTLRVDAHLYQHSFNSPR